MIRVTFQFIPHTLIDDIENHLHTESERYFDKSEPAEGYTTIHLQEGTELSYDTQGHIRFSSHTQGISEASLKAIYKSATEEFRELTQDCKQDFSVCMIMSGEWLIEEYLEHKNEILRFAKHKFGTCDLKYTELGTNTIKISFRQDTLRGRPNNWNQNNSHQQTRSQLL